MCELSMRASLCKQCLQVACTTETFHVSSAYLRGGAMMSMRAWVLVVVLVGVSACGATSAEPVSPTGRWETASHNLVVRIEGCGATMCGIVAQVLANNSMMGSGEAAVQPLPVGYRLINNLRRDGDHWRGRIFNRENGRTYDCTV